MSHRIKCFRHIHIQKRDHLVVVLISDDVYLLRKKFQNWLDEFVSSDSHLRIEKKSMSLRQIKDLSIYDWFEWLTQRIKKSYESVNIENDVIIFFEFLDRDSVNHFKNSRVIAQFNAWLKKRSRNCRQRFKANSQNAKWDFVRARNLVENKLSQNLLYLLLNDCYKTCDYRRVKWILNVE
jgi:hypothetical protein